MQNVADIYPLTPTQAGMLYHLLREDDPELYLEQFRADVTASADDDAWAAAWQTLVDRHPALRTIIVWKGLEEPRQVVREHVEIPVEVIDLRDLDAAEQAQVHDDVAASQRRDGLSLTTAPMSRVVVSRIADDRWHLIWTFHHIVVDGWSVGVLLDELTFLLTGEVIVDPATPFRDHVAHLLAQPPDLRRWDDVLGEVAEVAPVDLPGGTGVGRFERRRIDVKAEDDLARRVTAAARALRVTPNTFVQAAWALTLAHHTARDEAVFGVTMSGRDPVVDDVDRIVGMFLATLPMRLPIPAGGTVADWLAAVRDEQLELLAAQHHPLVEVRRRAALPADVELFDSVLVFENWPERAPHGDVRIEDVRVVEQSHYPLTVMAYAADRIELIMLYDADRFGADAVRQLGEHVVNMLAAMVDDLSAAPAALPAVSDESRHRQLVEWNDTAVEEPSTALATEWGRVVATAPDRVATIQPDDDGAAETQRTVGQLDEAARAVAAGLVAAGVRPGDPVGISMRRTHESVVALLGIVLAGAVYVPMDPTYPTARLELIARDSGIRHVVVHEATAGSVSGLADDQSTPIAELLLRDLAAHRPAARTELPERLADDPLYITYTSGSTGVPKGVVGHHRGVLSRCRWQWAAYPFGEDERVLQKVTLNFVDHLWELWGALLGGAPMVLVPEEVGADGRALVELARQHRIRRLVLTPSFVEAMIDGIPDLAERLADVETITLSGEGVSGELVDALRTAVPHVTPLNFYGMSEVTLDAATHDGREVVRSASFPIGRPIRNQQVYVLDQQRRLLPEGVVGRIHVSGVGLALGYHGRPDLTEERFVPHPFRAGERLYDTGDLGRWLPGGVLEYHGRGDDQVKIRGARLELGEVEAVLSATPDVAGVVAAAVGSGANRSLAAFVRPATDTVRTHEELCRAVREQASTALPPFMQPSTVHAIEDIPLTPNGKTDRNALATMWRQMVAAGSADDGATSAIDGELEASLVDAWSAALELPAGPNTDFFDAGGHSLTALRLAALIERSTGRDVALRDLLSFPTPRALADRLAVSEVVEYEHAHLVPMAAPPASDHADRTSLNAPVFCVHGAGGNVVHFTDIADVIGRRRPFIALQARGADGRGEPHATLHEMADAYAAEIEQVHAAPAPLVLAGYSAGGLVAWEIARRLVDRGHAVAGVLLLDTYHPTVRPRSRGIAELTREAASMGLAEAGGKVWRRLRNTAAEVSYRRQRRNGEVEVQGEARHQQMMEAIGGAFRAHTVQPCPVPVVLLSTTDQSSAFAHVPVDRGWTGETPDLRVIPVPGEHHDLLVGEVGRQTASTIDAVAAELVDAMSGVG